MISNFVDNLRVEHEQRNNGETSEMDNMMVDRERRRASVGQDTSGFNETQNRVQHAVVEAEKFKASVANPGMSFHNLNHGTLPGKQGSQNEKILGEHQPQVSQIGGLNLQEFTPLGKEKGMQIPDIGSGISDDDFFHLTCHIELSLIHKIEKGEFVELEKLLPKDKFNKSEDRLEWVQRDGGNFLVPAQRDSKIGSFRKWEQVFRAYATIYCGANPHRSKEIWQYITVINTTASSYLWENVYNYDITFRHLMAFNPQRSWAITYNQMWNLSMRDPIPKSGNQKSFPSYSYASSNRSGNSGTNNNNSRKSRQDYCWNFNKGVPCKFGAKCKFIERCKYCNSPSHGVNSCFKLQKKNESGSGQNKSDQSKSQANESK